MTRALITGITGQDGSYLAELLLSKGYEVWGLLRRSSTFNTSRIDHIFDKLNLVYGDMADSYSLTHAMESAMPHEVYNLAAQSHVKVSFEMPEFTANADAVGTLRLLQAIVDVNPSARFYQASTSEMFGSSPAPQNENTPFHPRSPYGASKLAAHWFTVNYREAYDLHASCGILFNHESPRRGGTFVTKKITQAVARIANGSKEKLHLGNLKAKRDWGYAPEYVEGMWRMLQQEVPGDYVFATGESHTVEEFVERAFAFVGLDWHDHVALDEKFYRPTEVDNLQGDASKARREFGWYPKVKFDALVKLMMEAEFNG